MPPDDVSDWPSRASAFAAALLDPSRRTPDDVVDACGAPAAMRYGVYRNNVTVSLIDALAAVYPAVQRITGVEFFRAMVRLHIRATPPSSPLLFECGRELPDFIEAFEHTKCTPWLADTARIERAWLDAYHAADAPLLSTEALADVPADRLAGLMFVPHPAARIVRSPYPAVSIFVMNRTEGPVEPLQSDTAEDALVTRPDMDVIVRRLPPGGAVFLTRLLAGETLAAATEAALSEAPSFDLAAGIATMIGSGVFTAIDRRD